MKSPWSSQGKTWSGLDLSFQRHREIAAAIIKDELTTGPKLREVVAAHLTAAVGGDAAILDAAEAAGVVRLKDSDGNTWWALPGTAGV